MKDFKHIICLICTLLIGGCAMNQPKLGNSFRLHQIEHANPYDDLKSAVAKGDYRFITLFGEGMYYPGMGLIEDFEKHYGDYGYKPVYGTSDAISSYEQGRLTAIAEYYAKRYNSELMKVLNNKKSLSRIKNIEGYDDLIERYNVNKVIMGGSYRYDSSIYFSLNSKIQKCVMQSRWDNPIVNGKTQFNWYDYFDISAKIEDAVCKQTWLKEWVNAEDNRSIESKISGLRPYTESDIDFFVKTAWQEEKLPSEPYYELNLRSGRECVGTLFISKDGLHTMITKYKSSGGNFWLEGMDFSYHPNTDLIEYVVVDKEGAWRMVSYEK